MTVLASVEVEVTGKLTPLEQAFEKGRREASSFEKDATKSVNKVADATESATKRMAGAQDAAADAAKMLAKGLAETSEEAKKLGLTETGLILHKQRLAKEANEAAKALERQAAAAKKAAEAQGPASGGLAEGASKATDALKGLAKGSEDSSRAQENLGKAVGSAVGQFANGLPSVDALATSARNVGGALLEMGPRAAMVGGAIGLVTGAVIAGAVAWNNYDKALASAELALYGVGKGAGLTSSEFMAMAEASADAANITDAAAREMQSAILGAGMVNRDILQDLIVTTEDYAAVTGQEAASAAKELGAAFADPIAGLEMLEERLGAVDGKTREHITSLVEQNRLTEAQSALLKVLQGEVAGAAKEVGLLAGAWASVTTWATQAFAAMGKAITLSTGGGTTDDRLNMLRGQRDREQNSPLGRTLPGLTRNTRRDSEIAELEATQRQERATAAAAAAQARRNEVDRQARSAVEALLPGDRQRAAITAQIADLDRAVAQGTMDRATADRARAQAQIRLNQIDKREAGPQGRRTSNAGASRAAQLRREAEAMELNASSAIELASAYLESGEAAVKAEADRTALTQATRRGTDVDAQAQRQLALNVANIAVSGAKSVAAMREETAARRAANNAVIEGGMSYREAAEWAEIDAAQRPLQNALIHAEGEAREQLTRIIEAQAEAISEANKEAARAQAIQQTESLEDQTELLQLEVSLIGKGNAERRIAIAQLQTMQRLRRAGLSADDPAGAGLLGAANDNAAAENAKEVATFMDRATKSTESQIRAFRESAATVNMTWLEAERYRKEQELLNAATEAGIELTDGQRSAIGQMASAYAAASEEMRKVEEQQRAIQDATQFATDQFSNFFDEIIFGSGSAEDALRSLVKSAGQAMLKGFLSGTGPLAGILGTQQQPGQAGGGLFGNLFGNFFKARVAHSGMSPGHEPASSRMVSPALFMNAPRLHDGLKPDEFPAILQKGEGVTPKGQKGGGGGNVVYMTVNTPNADSFRRSDRQIGRSMKRRLSV